MNHISNMYVCVCDYICVYTNVCVYCLYILLCISLNRYLSILSMQNYFAANLGASERLFHLSQKSSVLGYTQMVNYVDIHLHSSLPESCLTARSSTVLCTHLSRFADMNSLYIAEPGPGPLDYESNSFIWPLLPSVRYIYPDLSIVLCIWTPGTLFVKTSARFRFPGTCRTFKYLKFWKMKVH